VGAAALRLIAVRHAKAGELPGGPDAERALTERGHRDAGRAGRWLRDGGFVPDAVICSPARRTRQTWDGIAPELGRGVSCAADGRLYGADVGELLDVIAETAPEVTTLLCVGHNPAIGELAGDLAGQPLDFPTAAIAVIDVPGPWADLPAAVGELAAYWTPKLGD
jgi:phosphohistidine phosphatase